MRVSWLYGNKKKEKKKKASTVKSNNISLLQWKIHFNLHLGCFISCEENGKSSDKIV